jgi:UDP-glucose 4-epimerase
VYGDGLQRRDLVYIDDVVAAVLQTLDTGYDGRAIIGSGESVSVLELVEAVREVTGSPIPAEHVDAPPGEMPAVVVDVSASAATLGYKPTVSLTDGLSRTWQYFRDQ